MTLRVALSFATAFVFTAVTVACGGQETQKEVTKEKEVTTVVQQPVELKKEEPKKEEPKKEEPKEGGKAGEPAQKYEDLPQEVKEKLPEEAKQEIKQKLPEQQP